MKKYYFLFLFLVTSSFTYSQILNYSVGDVVTDFTVTDIHGNEHNLYTYTAAGKYVFIDFSFTTCGPCQQVAPIFNEFYDKYGCGLGEIMCFTMFGTNSDNNTDVENFENAHGGSFNHAPSISNDGGAIAVDLDFGVNTYPSTCIIAPDNTIIVLDIWPISGVASYEAQFPADFNPTPMSCDSAGVTDAKENELFSMYPNPSDGKLLNINLETADTARMNIYNILGEKIATYHLSQSQEVKEMNLAPGTYLVTVETAHTKETRKLIVK